MEKTEIEIRKLESDYYKVLLEKEKLEKDIATYNERFELEKNRYQETLKTENKKLWLSPLITLIVTIGAGLISAWVAHIIKNQELIGANINEATKTILNYSAQFDTTNNDRNKLFLSKIIARYPNYGDTNLQHIQNPFDSIYIRELAINTLGGDINQKAPAQDSAKYSAKARVSLDISDAAGIQLQNAKTNGVNQDSIKKIENTISQNKNIAINSLPDSIKTAVTNVSLVNEQIKDQFQSLASNPQNDVVKDYGLLWFKIGYYLQYENMRILLQDLDKKKGIQIQICQTTGSELCKAENSIITGQWISFDEPLTIMIDNSTYKISLKTIDHAGNNPFKLAAYVNVVKIIGLSLPDLSLVNIKLYSLSSIQNKAVQIDAFLKSKKIHSENLGSPTDYQIDNVRYNQIVFYSNDQIKYCQAIQILLEEKNYGHFVLRPSSGFGYSADHFKIYLVK